MTEQEAKKIVEQYWELVAKAAKTLAGTVISPFRMPLEKDEIVNIFICRETGALEATIHAYAPDSEEYAPIPDGTFEEL